MRSITLPCPRCGEAEAGILVRLNRLEDEDAFGCTECNTDFDVAFVKQIVAEWGPVLGWLDNAPGNEKEAAT